MAVLARALVTLVLLAPCAARADVKSCVDAHASGQRELKAGHLKEASARFTACGETLGCPGEIRAECVQFLREVERRQPSVIFSARDAAGHDVTEARVYAGDELLAEKLDGRAIALDPGRYTFRFAFGDGEVETELRLDPGQRDRSVSVTAPRAEPAQEPAPNRRRPSAPFWIAAGTSVVGLTSFGVFALLGRGRQSSVDACAPRCSDGERGDYDAMRRDYLIADVSLGVGLAAAGVATWLWLDRPSAGSARANRDRPRFALVPSLAPTKVELALRATTF